MTSMRGIMNSIATALTTLASKISATSDLPTVSASDNTKVLTVSGGTWVAAAPASQLPSVSASDNGDVLSVSGGAWAKVTPEPELPAVTADDNGKVLMVKEGAWSVESLPD